MLKIGCFFCFSRDSVWVRR